MFLISDDLDMKNLSSNISDMKLDSRRSAPSGNSRANNPHLENFSMMMLQQQQQQQQQLQQQQQQRGYQRQASELQTPEVSMMSSETNSKRNNLNKF
jgi:hypothetical protein